MNNNFTDFLQEIERRFKEINRLLLVVHRLEKRKNRKIQRHPSSIFFFDNQLDTLKGLIFVQLYGCIEYATSSSIRRCDEIISQQNLKLSDYRRSLFPRLLNSKFDALHLVGREKKWIKRLELMHEIIEDIDIKENSCKDLEIPTDGKNIRYAQLKSIWDTFGIHSSIFPSPELGNRLSDVVDNRNKIAHGNISPSEIGKKQSYREMKARSDEIRKICEHIITAFSNYIRNREYLN